MLESLSAFAVVAALLTITPGVDTLLMLRAAATSGRHAAFAANLGISLGCFAWAVASAGGLTALLAASQTAYDLIRYAGAGYLCWLGVQALRPRRPATAPEQEPAGRVSAGRVSAGRAFRQGLVTNLLNPKVGVFYLSLLPQFIPAGYAPLPTSLALAAVHLAEGVLWCGVLVLAVHRARHLLTRPGVLRWSERITGVVFVGLGARLAVDAAQSARIA